MLGANLIGFQIYDYVRHFMTACARLLGTDVNVESTYILDATNRTSVTVDAFPEGIDCARCEQLLASAKAETIIERIRTSFTMVRAPSTTAMM